MKSEIKVRYNKIYLYIFTSIQILLFNILIIVFSGMRGQSFFLCLLLWQLAGPFMLILFYLNASVISFDKEGIIFSICFLYDTKIRWEDITNISFDLCSCSIKAGSTFYTFSAPGPLMYANKNEIYEFINNMAPENLPVRKILLSLR